MGTPMPRKLRVASSRMKVPTCMVARTMMEVITLGSTYFRMIRQLGRPITRCFSRRTVIIKRAGLGAHLRLKGLKIRTQQSRSAMDMVTLLGGAPTPIPWGELYTALSQGTVDGAENNLPSFDTGRHMEVCKYFTFSRHSRVPDVLVISRATWKSLTPQERKWITEAARESSLYQRKLWQEAEKRARERAGKQGVRFLTVDTAEFADRMKPMYESMPQKTAELIRKIQEVK